MQANKYWFANCHQSYQNTTYHVINASITTSNYESSYITFRPTCCKCHV